MNKFLKGMIQSLVAAGLSTYIYIGFVSSEQHWSDIFEPTDPALGNATTCALIQKIKDLKICGIILNINDLYVSIQCIKYYNF